MDFFFGSAESDFLVWLIEADLCDLIIKFPKSTWKSFTSLFSSLNHNDSWCTGAPLYIACCDIFIKHFSLLLRPDLQAYGF